MPSGLWVIIAFLGLYLWGLVGSVGLYAVARVYRRTVSHGAGRLMACVSTAFAGMGLAIALVILLVAYVWAMIALAPKCGIG